MDLNLQLMPQADVRAGRGGFSTIEVISAPVLKPSDIEILRLLWQRARDSGRMADPDAEWEIPLAQLSHATRVKDGDLSDCTHRLLGIVIAVPEECSRGAWEAHLFDHISILADKAVVRFGLSRRLQSFLIRRFLAKRL